MYMDDKQAAEFTNLSPSYLRKLRVNGGGPPFIKIGRMVRYNRDDIQAWLKSRTISHTLPCGT
jgi:excisionase family DNA binding protein